MSGTQYTARHRSLLRAVAQGRAQLSGGSHPCLRVDGLWCDQTASSQLANDGLVRAAAPGTIAALVPAVLTAAGARLLTAGAAAALPAAA